MNIEESRNATIDADDPADDLLRGILFQKAFQHLRTGDDALDERNGDGGERAGAEQDRAQVNDREHPLGKLIEFFQSFMQEPAQQKTQIRAQHSRENQDQSL